MQTLRHKSKRGGARVGAGRHRRRIALDAATAAKLASLKKRFQQQSPQTTEEKILCDLIDAEWQRVEANETSFPQ